MSASTCVITARRRWKGKMSKTMAMILSWKTRLSRFRFKVQNLKMMIGSFSKKRKCPQMSMKRGQREKMF